MSKIKAFFKDKKKINWLTTFRDVAIVLLILFAVMKYQNRDTLASNNLPAPEFSLQDLSGEFHQLSDYKGKTVMIYFFAPWCSVCRLSSGNLNNLRESKDESELAVIAIGSSFEQHSEVVDFAKEKGFEFPVLFGNDQLLQEYEIKGFPTYFVIDEEGKIKSRSIGYSTELGMRIRT